MDPTSLKLLLFASMTLASFGLGGLIAHRLRLPELKVRIGLVLFAVGLPVFSVMTTTLIEGKSWRDTYKSGVDVADHTDSPTDPGLSSSEGRTEPVSLSTSRPGGDAWNAMPLTVRPCLVKSGDVTILAARTHHVASIMTSRLLL